MGIDPDKFRISVSLDSTAQSFIDLVQKKSISLDVNIVAPKLEAINSMLNRIDSFNNKTITLNFKAVGLDDIEARLTRITSRQNSSSLARTSPGPNGQPMPSGFEGVLQRNFPGPKTGNVLADYLNSGGGNLGGNGAQLNQLVTKLKANQALEQRLNDYNAHSKYLSRLDSQYSTGLGAYKPNPNPNPPNPNARQQAAYLNQIANQYNTGVTQAPQGNLNPYAPYAAPTGQFRGGFLNGNNNPNFSFASPQAANVAQGPFSPIVSRQALQQQIREENARERFSQKESGDVAVNSLLNRLSGGRLGEDATAFEIKRKQQVLLSTGLDPRNTSIFGNKTTPTFDPLNRLFRNKAAVQQTLFAGLFGAAGGEAAGGIPGALLGGATGLLGAGIGASVGGEGGAFLGSTISQGIVSIAVSLFETIKNGLTKAAEAGIEFNRSILAVGSTLNASTTVFDASGKQASGVESIAFNQKRARTIQQTARPRLATLGIAGESEATLVQAVISGAAQRGIILNAEQAATLAERIGGAAQAQRPEILNNSAQLRRDIEDIFSGSPQGARTALGSTIRPFINKLQGANSGEDFLKASDTLKAFPESIRNSDNPVTSLARISGDISNILTKVGDSLLTSLKPGLDDIAKTLADPKVSEGAANLAQGIGKLGSVILTTLASLGNLVFSGASSNGESGDTSSKSAKEARKQALRQGRIGFASDSIEDTLRVDLNKSQNTSFFEDLLSLNPATAGFFGKNAKTLDSIKKYLEARLNPSKSPVGGNSSAVNPEVAVSQFLKLAGIDEEGENKSISSGRILREFQRTISELPSGLLEGETRGGRNGLLAKLRSGLAKGYGTSEFNSLSKTFLEGNDFSSIRKLQAQGDLITGPQSLAASGEIDAIKQQIAEKQSSLRTGSFDELGKSNISEQISGLQDKLIEKERALGEIRGQEIGRLNSLTDAEKKRDLSLLSTVDTFTAAGRDRALSIRETANSNERSNLSGQLSGSDSKLADLQAQLSRDPNNQGLRDLLNQEQDNRSALGIRQGANLVESSELGRARQLQPIDEQLNKNSALGGVQDAANQIGALADKSAELATAFGNAKQAVQDFGDKVSYEALDNASKQQELFNKVSKGPGGLLALSKAGLSQEDIARLSGQSDDSLFGGDFNAENQQAKDIINLRGVTKTISRAPDKNADDLNALFRNLSDIVRQGLSLPYQQKAAQLNFDKSKLIAGDQQGYDLNGIQGPFTSQVAPKLDFNNNLPGTTGNPFGAVTSGAGVTDAFSKFTATTDSAANALSALVLAITDATNQIKNTAIKSNQPSSPNYMNLPPAQQAPTTPSWAQQQQWGTLGAQALQPVAGGGAN